MNLTQYAELAAKMLDFASTEAPPVSVSNRQCYVFAPLAFALVSSLRPQRVLEMGTVAGDTYLTLCEAVRIYNVKARCCCIPDNGAQACEISDPNSSFRGYHDSAYGHFSEVIIGGSALSRIEADKSNLGLVHLIEPSVTKRL